MTKEELLKEYGEIQVKLDIALVRDKEMRQEFARAFNWVKLEGMYQSEKRPIDCSWNQIFTEIGKLQATQSFYDLQGSVTELHRQMQNINENLLDSPQD